ncbi:MAG: carboxypeptidase regulatory-like domain-containing protein [Anaerolineales bacterium]|nr:carboxypeptidase regulatory-like domain-containing protein [Anaerolineales bacterium]
MKYILILIAGILILMLAACGPSPEQIATMTASAWTPTPPPTATPTPVPYDVNVSIVDESGAPISEAGITFPESGNSSPVKSDVQGRFSWKNLAGESANLSVSAQGYLPAQQTATLQRGVNEISITLTRDPFGLLPSEACTAGEKLLYAEDFQDNRAQDWNEIDLKTPGWNTTPSAAEAGNIILSAQDTDMADGLNSRMTNGMLFENAAWRVRFLISKPFASDQNWFSFNWKSALEPFDLNGQQIFDSRYQLPVGTNQFALRRVQQPASNVGIGQVKGPKIGEWHLAEILTFQDVTEVWLDGTRLMSYQDPQPIPPGTIGLELRLQGNDVVVYFDNLSVCELSAPFTSIAPAAP